MNEKSRKRMLWLCTLLVLGALGYYFTLHLNVGRADKLFVSYVPMLPFVFLGVMLCISHGKRPVDLWVGYAWLGWFLLSRVLLKDPYLIRSSLSWFISDCFACMVALSFAWTLQDEKRKFCLRTVAVFVLLVMTALSIVALYAAWIGKTISIPMIGGHFGVERHSHAVYRLEISSHPNTGAALIVASMVLGAWLLAASRYRRWLTGVILLCFAVLYVACALLVSRTGMIQLAFFAATLAAVLILRYPPRWLSKCLPRILCAVVAAALIFVASYQSFGWTVTGFNTLKTASHSAAEEVQSTQKPQNTQKPKATKKPSEQKQVIRQRELKKDIFTLTGRTTLFAQAFDALKEDPKMLAFGTVHRDQIGEMKYNAHNSYLQITLCLGLPGLALALFFTLRVLWLCLKIVLKHFKKTTAADLVLVCAMPTMLLNTITEPIIFYDLVPIYNIVFFLIYGYLIEIEHRLRSAA